MVHCEDPEVALDYPLDNRTLASSTDLSRVLFFAGRRYLMILNESKISVSVHGFIKAGARFKRTSRSYAMLACHFFLSGFKRFMDFVIARFMFFKTKLGFRKKSQNICGSSNKTRMTA